MINGFFDQTADLSDSERKLVPVVATYLQNAVGASNAVFSDHIRQVTGLSGPRVRKVINYIRTNGLVPCLVASSRGYYVAESEQELLEYEDSLTGRANEILRVRDKIAEQRMERYEPKQLSLF